MNDPASPSSEKPQKKRHSSPNGLPAATPTREKRLRKLNPIYADYEQDKVTEKVQQSIITGTAPTKKRKSEIEQDLASPPPKKLPKGYALVPELPQEEKPLPSKRERKKVNYAENAPKPQGKKTTKISTPPVEETSPVRVDPVQESKSDLIKQKKERRKELEEKLSALDTQLELLGEDIEAKTPKDVELEVSFDPYITPQVPESVTSPMCDLMPLRATPTSTPTRSHRTPKKRGQSYTPIKEALPPALEGCRKVLKSIMEHRHAWPFNKPVDPIALGIPDYFDIIKHPMDFGTIKHNLDTHAYDNEDEFCSHVRLVFSNAFRYNPPEHDICLMARTLSKQFEKSFSNLKAQLAKGYGAATLGLNTVEATLIEIRAVREEIQKLRDEAQSMSVAAQKPPVKPKGRKSVKDDNRPMTFEEKKNLSLNINKLPSEALGMVVKIVYDHMPQMTQTTEGRELEIDLDQLDARTLRALERYVSSVLNKGKRTRTRPLGAKKGKIPEKPKETEIQTPIANGKNGKNGVPKLHKQNGDSSSSSGSDSSSSDSSDSSDTGSDSSDSSDSEDDMKHKTDVSVPPTVPRSAETKQTSQSPESQSSSSLKESLEANSHVNASTQTTESLTGNQNSDKAP